MSVLLTAFTGPHSGANGNLTLSNGQSCFWYALVLPLDLREAHWNSGTHMAAQSSVMSATG